ncbi:MAG: hypothetical protein A3C71_01115 [Candidatus Yanofskybacteria bacterium RIFCSPHIGHO2_02_FULL_43_15c]|uniref:Four helix bundle protein n=1 Tax=Candidatus Yanofskybacteria bacterium RIFCSPHIGHO2_02_FULL_43_15c TaxID=1802679 RepID=A0A1F8FIE5_9BACT|nr:MAG: hypothetical protein A3C71_01115 [Candidatus Yanofskybacteria bacterium RIFCSPHIGHO2_02_FULL_43_15c]
MTELDQYRKSLRPAGEQYSNTQLEEFRKNMDALAEFLLDWFSYKRSRRSSRGISSEPGFDRSKSKR